MDPLAGKRQFGERNESEKELKEKMSDSEQWAICRTEMLTRGNLRMLSGGSLDVGFK